MQYRSKDKDNNRPLAQACLTNKDRCRIPDDWIQLKVKRLIYGLAFVGSGAGPALNFASEATCAKAAQLGHGHDGFIPNLRA